jgi:hypothetical protein
MIQGQLGRWETSSKQRGCKWDTDGVHVVAKRTAAGVLSGWSFFAHRLAVWLVLFAA